MSTEESTHKDDTPNGVQEPTPPRKVDVIKELDAVDDEEVPEYEILSEPEEPQATEASETPSPDVPAAEETVSPPEPTIEEQEVVTARALTRARVRDLRALLGKYIRRHLPETPPPVKHTDEPPRFVGTHAKVLPYLRLIPWALAALFALSFLWDFDGMVLRAFGYELPLDGLLRIVSVSGLIGFFTNWLAITMLFNPRKRRPIFGQGLIPAQRERVIYRLARAVSEELINEEIIKAKIEESRVIPKYREMALSVTHGVLEDPEFRAELKQLTSDYIDKVLTSDAVRKKIVDFTVQKLEEYTSQSLGGLAIKAYRFLNEEDFQRRIDLAVQQLPKSVDLVLDEMDHLLDRLPEKIAERSDEIEQWVTKTVLGFVSTLDVYDMIIGNMRQYDEQKLETLIKNSSNEQLNYIKYLGGLLGFFGGLVIWRPLLALTVFGAIGLILYTLDVTLLRLQKREDQPASS